MKVYSGFVAIIILLTISKSAIVQNYDPFIQSVVDQISLDSLQSNLMIFESYGRKQLNDPGLENTAEWLISTYSGYGYTDIQMDSFSFMGYDTYNIIITKQGVVYPNVYVIIDGHYDTKTGPGVNDNGTGIAIILEIARLLKNIPTKYSIKFMNFSAEEYGLIGSSHYVQNVVVPQNMEIKIVYNIDEVGGINESINDIVVCERDESPPSFNNSDSWAYTDTLVALTGLYSDLIPEISYAYGSDYVPFQSNGEIITGIFEFNYSPYAHTVHDSLVNLDLNYVYEMGKISIAAGMYFAQAFNPGTGNSFNRFHKDTILVFPMTHINEIIIDVTENTGGINFLLMDNTGRIKISASINSGQISKIPVGVIRKGIYMYALIGDRGEVKKSGKIFWY